MHVDDLETEILETVQHPVQCCLVDEIAHEPDPSPVECRDVEPVERGAHERAVGAHSDDLAPVRHQLEARGAVVGATAGEVMAPRSTTVGVTAPPEEDDPASRGITRSGC